MRVNRILPRVPKRVIETSKGLLYTRIPYGLSQRIERAARPEVVAGAYNLAASAREFRAVFIHIPKAAGVSIKNSLFGDGKFGGHHPIRDYMMVLDRNEFRDFFKFCFVRNPWDRVLSAYRFLAAGGMTPEDVQWSQRELAGVADFRTFVMERLGTARIQSSLHFRPQLGWISDPGGRVVVDMIARFERLEEDYETIRKRLGVPHGLAWENKTPGARPDYRAMYTDEMAEAVARVYRPEIERLDYSF